jgi:hydroxymethylbilane synthase
MAQATLVRDALAGAGHDSSIIVIQTEGDRRAPDTAWGEGAFVAAIERALLDGRVDIAVHSAKDIPTTEDRRLRIAAYLPRADARDALVTREGETSSRLDDLPSGFRIGTDSPRRTAFLRARRPDLVFHPLHGNVDTRLRRLDAGETDVLVLACAGLDRLGLSHRIAERLEPELVPPAPGQGAIAIQVRSDDDRLLELAASIDHEPTRAGVEAERAFLNASGGGCRAPIGAFATVEGAVLDLLGGHVRGDGSAVRFGRRSGTPADAAEVGRELAAELGLKERRSLVPSVSGAPAAGRPRILVTRAATQARELVAAAREAGLEPVLLPTIEVELASRIEIDAAVGPLHAYTWVVITSVNGARAIIENAGRDRSELAAASWAAMGHGTRRFLERDGINVDFVPSRPASAALAAELPIASGDRIVLIRGDLADRDVGEDLRHRGAEVHDVVAYRTREAPTGSRRLLHQIDVPSLAAVIFTSGSTVRGLIKLADAESIDVRSLPAVCIGPVTADEARSAGFDVIAVSPVPEAATLAQTAATALARQPVEAS